MPSRWTRFKCWLLGCRWVGEQRGAPVIPLFLVCRRCGKWERIA